MSSASLSSSTSSASGGKRLVKSKSGLKIVCQHDREAAPWDLAEPHWTPDAEVTNCVGCNVKFDFLKRRHHCRRCGQIFCNNCCSARVQFHRMGFVDPVRLCGSCADLTKAEEDFFDNDIKVLCGGAPFNVSTVSSAPSTPSEVSSPWNTDGSDSQEDISQLRLSEDKEEKVKDLLLVCKLSASQKHLLFAKHKDVEDNEELSDEESIVPPVDLARVIAVETEALDAKQGASCLTLRVKMNHTQELTLKLDSPPEPSKKPSVLWLTALRKGLGFVFDSRKCNEDEEETTGSDGN